MKKIERAIQLLEEHGQETVIKEIKKHKNPELIEQVLTLDFQKIEQCKEKIGKQEQEKQERIEKIPYIDGNKLKQEEILEIDATKEEEAEIIRIEEDFFGGTITIANIKEINENDEITKGSQFEIRRKDTEEVEQHFTTNGKEEQIEMLETNVPYEIVETSPIPGYTTAEKVSFHLTENGTVIVEEGAEQEENTIIIRDYPTKVQIKIIDEETKNYISTLRNFYNIKETTIQTDLFDITEFNSDDIIQIIPQEKKTKFDKNKFTILQIEV